MLTVNNLCKSYGAISVLNNINITVNPGSIIGLAGSSGSGKSTLLRCLQKLELADQGTIECKAQTAFMFQDFQLFPHMPVLKNLTYAPQLHYKSADQDERAITILNNLGMVDKANHFPGQLSGGQKQRVALARSLMMQPELLFCDEPTSGLDVATILDVISLLQSVRDMGVTMMIASHDLDFLTKTADRIIVLKNGEIALDVNPKTLTDPVFYLKNYY